MLLPGLQSVVHDMTLILTGHVQVALQLSIGAHRMSRSHSNTSGKAGDVSGISGDTEEATLGQQRESGRMRSQQPVCGRPPLQINTETSVLFHSGLGSEDFLWLADGGTHMGPKPRFYCSKYFAHGTPLFPNRRITIEVAF
uniref:Uncharacterized protein n=1 Tax=Sphaerodactylus townsendi TaxID=933632 RepID=A0ACB8FTR7_9SAUR